MKRVEIKIAREFSNTPGARYISDGPFSGEEFREKFLERHFANGAQVDKIVINLDGAIGYATSFLEEAFGGLARKFGKEKCLERLEFVCNEDPLIIKEIKKYIEEANE
ncbi:MAG: DUF4325 domain-containing protein [Candidatus Brocadia sp.]|nr:MAG: DUF4325 domain-containing protein [Candidatus Brocadia sp.]